MTLADKPVTERSILKFSVFFPSFFLVTLGGIKITFNVLYNPQIQAKLSIAWTTAGVFFFAQGAQIRIQERQVWYPNLVFLSRKQAP